MPISLMNEKHSSAIAFRIVLASMPQSHRRSMKSVFVGDREGFITSIL